MSAFLIVDLLLSRTPVHIQPQHAVFFFIWFYLVFYLLTRGAELLLDAVDALAEQPVDGVEPVVLMHHRRAFVPGAPAPNSGLKKHPAQDTPGF